MKEYIAIINEYGLCTLIFVVGLSIATPLLKRWAENTRIFTQKTIRPSHLIKHSFFSQMNYWRKIGIDAIEIEEPAKALMIKDWLHIQSRTVDLLMREVIASQEIARLSQLELKDRMITCLTDAIKACELEAHECDIPVLLIRKFAKWHRRSLIFMMKGIEECTLNAYYKTNTERLQGVLGILLVVFNATIIDAERTLNDLNGDLKGLTYKGLQITR